MGFRHRVMTCELEAVIMPVQGREAEPLCGGTHDAWPETETGRCVSLEFSSCRLGWGKNRWGFLACARDMQGLQPIILTSLSRRKGTDSELPTSCCRG